MEIWRYLFTTRREPPPAASLLPKFVCARVSALRRRHGRQTLLLRKVLISWADQPSLSRAHSAIAVTAADVTDDATRNRRERRRNIIVVDTIDIRPPPPPQSPHDLITFPKPEEESDPLRIDRQMGLSKPANSSLSGHQVFCLLLCVKNCKSWYIIGITLYIKFQKVFDT